MSTYQVRTLEEADQIIKEHERKTKTVYSLLRSTKNFGCVNVPACANEENEVRFETVGVPYCGVPFFVAGLKILQCQALRVSVLRKRKFKMEAREANSVANVTINSKVHGVNDGGFVSDEDEIAHIKTPSKKRKKNGKVCQIGCTATVIMKEVIYYPEFQLYEHSKSNRIAVARQLKETLKNKTVVMKDRIIYVTVPASTDHFGHPVGMISSKRIYFKNDFYGAIEPGSSKKTYCPIKQEKSNTGTPSPIKTIIKIDEDDTEAKAKQVREILQSIMSLTYKPGTTTAFDQLFKDLFNCKLNYQQTMEDLMSGVTSSVDPSAPIVNVVETPESVSSFSATPQVVTVQTGVVKSSEALPVTWQPARAVSLASSASVIPGQATVVAVAGLPLTVSTTTSGHGVVTVPNTVAIQGQTTTNGSEANSQETSIFIEAMEAIFNSQM